MRLRPMRITVLLASLLWLSMVPALQTTVAQSATPTPAPPSDVIAAANTAVDAAERLGVLGFIAVIVALIALGIVIVFVIVLLRIGVKPFFELINTLRGLLDQARTELTTVKTEMKQLVEHGDTEVAQLRKQQADSLKTVAQYMPQLETATTAQVNRNSAVNAINNHTDSEHAASLVAIQKMLNQAIVELGGVQQKHERQRTPDDHTTADLAITNVQRTLVEANEQVKKLGDTGPLPEPAPVPPAPPVPSTESLKE